MRDETNTNAFIMVNSSLSLVALCEWANAWDRAWASDDSRDLVLRMHLVFLYAMVNVYTHVQEAKLNAPNIQTTLSFSATKLIKMLLRHNKIFFMCLFSFSLSLSFNSYCLLPGSQQQVFCVCFFTSCKHLFLCIVFISWAIGENRNENASKCKRNLCVCIQI